MRDAPETETAGENPMPRDSAIADLLGMVDLILSEADYCGDWPTDLIFGLSQAAERMRAEHAAVLPAGRPAAADPEIARLQRAIAGMNGVSDHQTDRRGGVVQEIDGFRMRFHPLTCGKDSRHAPLYPYWDGRRVVLICRDCDYTQGNAAMFSTPAEDEPVDS